MRTVSMTRLSVLKAENSVKLPNLTVYSNVNKNSFGSFIPHTQCSKCMVSINLEPNVNINSKASHL